MQKYVIYVEVEEQHVKASLNNANFFLRIIPNLTFLKPVRFFFYGSLPMSRKVNSLRTTN